MVQVREKVAVRPVLCAGRANRQTTTRYVYRNLAGTAFVSKSSSIHLAPCTCARREMKPGVARRVRGVAWRLATGGELKERPGQATFLRPFNHRFHEVCWPSRSIDGRDLAASASAQRL
jgi:hypothetical protein